MQLFTDRRYRDILLLILGLSGLIWFLTDLDEHHPFGALDIPYDEDEVVSKIDSALKNWGLLEPYEVYQIELKHYESLLEQLSQRRPLEYDLEDLPVYYWELMELSRLDEEEETGSVSYNNIQADLRGNVIGLSVPERIYVDEGALNEEAIRYAMMALGMELDRFASDTLATALAEFQNMERNNLGTAGKYFREQGEEFIPRSGYFTSVVSRLAEKYSSYYLERSGWKDFAFRADTVFLMETTEVRVAQVELTAGKEIMGVRPSLTIEVLPAGMIKSMSVSLPEAAAAGNSVMIDVRLLAVLIFGAWLIIIFYLRIKARAVDTQLAFIIAVLIGFLLPGVVALGILNSIGVINAFQSDQIFRLIILMGLSGAGGSIAFFVLTAVSDSVTRQYWAEKLRTWDLIRQGWFKNKPTGWALLGAIAVGAIMAGAWQLMLDLLPVQSVGFNGRLLNDDYLFPSVVAILTSVLVSLALVLSLFLILSNQLFGLTGKKWVIPLIGAVGFSIFNVNPIEIQPLSYELLINGILGFLLGYFYIQFDFLSVAGGYFIFYGLMLSASGWLIGNSPDSNVFLIFMILLVSMLMSGIFLTYKGTEREELPDYVPDYIEDQAKEQRVRQELAIARVVQETFLPSKVERLKGLDIAGICKPAQDTGGDYYDLISLGSNRTALAIGDVSGKGIKAAFYMTFTKGVLHSLSAIILSPLELLNQLNRLFKENATRGTFISMIYGLLEADRRVFTFARAGHNPILVVHEDGSSEWLNSKGLGIGVASSDDFIRHTEEVEYKIKEGDVIVLYTDGVTEMMDPGGRFYGEERLRQLVNAIKEDSAEQILKKITGDVREFKGTAKQHDDMTLLIIKADARVEAPY
ncbi:PP2C family protein-serine/threonine phosphatase [Balneola sp. MJW-20]|uniref:PP2C family protein-serine/threonine phosphatase n=1 Tax=Gracilimonas aurantiaca TaxID=3234185 RepID=UPI003466F2ED